MSDTPATPATSTTVSATPSSVTTASTVKPAYLTTEAWFNFATGAVGLATSAGLIGKGSTLERALGLGLMAWSMAVHAWSRTSVKNAAVGS